MRGRSKRSEANFGFAIFVISVPTVILMLSVVWTKAACLCFPKRLPTNILKPWGYLSLELPPNVLDRPVLISSAETEPRWLPPVRLPCVDLVRGLVMVLMALDHAHFFFSRANSIPEYMPDSSAALFFTRWISHFCAPAFFYLAGAGAFLSHSLGQKSPAQISKFLWTRGLWLIFLCCTVIGHAWTFLFPFAHGGVIWALGLSMIVMALLIRLPLPSIAFIGVAILLTHNLFDRISPAAFGPFSFLWYVLHYPGVYFFTPTMPFFVLFTLIPWVGVMAVGYASGPLLLRLDRRKVFFLLGAMLTVAFFVFRVFDLYGNSSSGLRGPFPDYYSAGPWTMQHTLPLTIASFFNTLKYPASLQFLLMTLGPILMALAWFDKLDPGRGLGHIFHVFGRVPLFFYILHLYFLHSMAVWIAALGFHQHVAWLLYGGPLLLPIPPDYGHDLPFIYAMWLVVLLLLYLPCKWFMNLKQQHKDWWWLSYL